MSDEPAKSKRPVGRPNVTPGVRRVDQHAVTVRVDDSLMPKLEALAAHAGVKPGRFATDQFALLLESLDWPTDDQETLPLDRAS